jgi:hypothetical protein
MLSSQLPKMNDPGAGHSGAHQAWIGLGKRPLLCQVLVAHACNPNYSGDRDQEDHSSKPAPANSSQDPIVKNPSQKRAGGTVQGVDPEFKTPVPPPKKKKVWSKQMK